MQVKVFESTFLGVAISVIDMSGLTGLSKVSNKQNSHLYIKRRTDTASHQISLCHFNGNNMVSELSIDDSLHSIVAVALPTTILFQPAQRSPCEKLFEFFIGNPVFIRLMSQPMDVSEVVVSNSFNELTCCSLSTNSDVRFILLFNNLDLLWGITLEQIKTIRHQNTCFNLTIGWYHMQEFCKLEGYALKAEKKTIASEEFSRGGYDQILKFWPNSSSLDDTTEIEKFKQAVQYGYLNKTG